MQSKFTQAVGVFRSAGWCEAQAAADVREQLVREQKQVDAS